MVLWILQGCSADFEVDPDEVTNRWWHFEKAETDVYLEFDEVGLCGTTWYSSLPPIEEPLDRNLNGGTWCTSDFRHFWLTWEGEEYTLRITESSGDCWEVSISVYTDTACPTGVDQ